MLKILRIHESFANLLAFLCLRCANEENFSLDPFWKDCCVIELWFGRSQSNVQDHHKLWWIFQHHHSKAHSFPAKECCIPLLFLKNYRRRSCLIHISSWRTGGTEIFGASGSGSLPSCRCWYYYLDRWCVTWDGRWSLSTGINQAWEGIQ